MRITAFITLFLVFLFAPEGLILAQEDLLSAEPGQTASITKIELPASPMDQIFNEWIVGGKLQSEAQKLMNNLQNKIKEQLGGTMGQVQTAVKEEIRRQALKQFNDVRQSAQSYVQALIGEIKKVIAGLTENIKNILINLFNKP